MFVSIDGPSGCGKTTTVSAVRTQLAAAGRAVWSTAEPSTAPIGQLARQLTDTVAGPALACLFAADRYHHLDLTVKPRVAAGEIVISDRYLASGLSMQRFDQVPLSFLAAINSLAPAPDLAVVLTARPEVNAARLSQRGRHNRMQEQPDSSRHEAHFYADAVAHLRQLNYPLLILDVTGIAPEQAAHRIVGRIFELIPGGRG